MRALAFLAVPLLAAAAPPADKPKGYIAVGTEPFWDLEIGQRTMALHPPEGIDGVTVKTPKARKTGYGRIYWTKAMQVYVVRTRDCSDGMSDFIYRDEVEVRAGDLHFKGCGGPRWLADYVKDN